MKIPINWLKEYVKVPTDVKGMCDKLTMVGHMLDSIDQGKYGTVIDLELRGNRADCYSIYGIARDVAAIYKTKTKYPETLRLKKTKTLKEAVLKPDAKYVKRAMMSVVKNVTIEPSPKWLKDALTAYGLESINNIVDLTNYVAIELGGPMHAFDLDKIESSLEIRLAKKKEKMLTFQGTTLTLTEDDLVWANKDCVLSVAGAIGEKTNSISTSTKNILVEAANYDRANIRRSVHRHSLFTEAGIRHEKELDPEMVEAAIGRFLYLIQKHKWGEVSGVVSDYYPKPVKPWKITINWNSIKRITGVDIPQTAAKSILESLNFEVEKSTKENFTVIVPTYRTDVLIEADVVEEIIRIYGYDKITPQILSLSIPEDVTPNFIFQETRIKNILVKLGFDEVITSSFVKEDKWEINKSSDTKSNSVSLQNPPSPDFRDMRVTLLPNLVELAKKAINERTHEVRFFEVGKVYNKKGTKYSESRKVGFAYFESALSSFSTFKGFVTSFLEEEGITNYKFENTENFSVLTDTYEIKIGKNSIGFGGMYENIYFAEIDLESILPLTKKPSVTLWPKYPPQIEDITIKLPEKTQVGEVEKAIQENNLVRETELIDTYENSYTFRVTYQSAEKTLTNDEVEAARKAILTKITSSFGGKQA